MILLMEHNAGKNRINSSNEGERSDSFGIQIHRVLVDPSSKWILCLITYNTVIIYYLCGWVTSTNSIALSAYVNTVFFNVLSLLVCLISVWVAGRSPKFDERLNGFSDTGYLSSSYTIRDPENGRATSLLGAERYEVLALLASSCLVLAGGSFISMEIILRLSDQPSVHTGRLGLGALLGVVAHLGTILAYPDAGLNHVLRMALPCDRFNPILGSNILSAVVLCGTHFVVHTWELHAVDTAAALAVIGLTATSMLPLAFYTFGVVLQKVPHHATDLLDGCLRETLRIDGVLEFRNERFWTRSLGKMAGTLEVRVRRNANEAHVLASVTRHLSRAVSLLQVRGYREPRVNLTVDHPAEYYIDEILAVRTKRIDTKVVKIEEILAPESLGDEYLKCASGIKVSTVRNALISGAKFHVDETALSLVSINFNVKK